MLKFGTKVKPALTSLVLIVVCVMSTSSTSAQSRNKNQPEFLNIEQILEQVAINVGVRYNLNDAQVDYTEQMLKDGVNRFLRENSEDVWPVIRQLMSGRLIGELPDDPEEARRLANSAIPLAQKAEKAILSHQDEWRTILTPEQQKLHDFDLQLMRRQFDSVHDNLKAAKEGNAMRNNVFPPPELYPDEPHKPKMPPPGLPSERKPDLPRESGRGSMNSNMFTTFVEEFIKDCELDAAQITTARSILRQYKGRADSYLSSNESNIAQARAAYEKARKDKDRKAIAEAEQKQKELLKPVYQHFTEMEQALIAQLTSAQKEKYEKSKSNKSDNDKKKATETKQKRERERRPVPKKK